MRVLPAGETTIYCIAFAPDGSLLAGTKDGRVLRLAPFQEPRVLVPSPTETRSEINAIATAGESILIASAAGWRIADVHESPAAATAITALDDSTLVLGLGDRGRPSPGGLELWRWSGSGAPSLLKPVFKEPKGVLAVAVHRAERLVAWSTGHQKIMVWNPRGQDPIPIPLKHTSPAIAFHPNGLMLAAAQEWGAVFLDISKRHEVAKLAGHTGRVTSLAFAPDGRTLATASWDGTVKLWDGTSGAAIASLVGPLGRVMSVAYSPDGLQLAAAGDAGNVVVWDAD